MDKKLTVFIFTCDAYKPLWKYAYNFYCSNFPKSYVDNLYFVSDCKPSNESIESIPVTFLWPKNKDDFIEKIELCLSVCKTDYFLFLLNDYFLTYPIKESTIDNYLDFVYKYNCNYLKLNIRTRKRLKHRFKFEGLYYSSIKQYMPYGVDLYPSIWKASFINTICDKWPFEGKTIWDFEGKFYKLGSYFKIDNCFCCRSPVFKFTNVVCRGTIFRDAHRKLKKKYNIDLTSFKPLMSRKMCLFEKMGFFLHWMPEKLKEHIKARNRKRGKKYYS